MSGRTLKILLIDDNPADAELLRRLLNKISEFQVEFTHCLDAESGQQALAARKTDCLLLDYRLGEHDGLEVLASIRALGDDVPTIVLTGAGNETVAVEAMKRGAQDYMVKDVVVRQVMTPKALYRAITNAIEKVRLKRLVAEKQRELEAFVSVASHDLKTPLCSVRNNVEVILDFYRDKPLDARGNEFLVAALRMVDRMTKMLDSLLEYTRAGRSAKALGPVDLKSCMKSVVENLKALIEETQARVIVGLMPPTVAGDEDALVQLLQNLISNGTKFSRGEPVVVRVTSRREGDQWEISIEDNGIGIDAQHHAAIFAPFKRLHSKQEFDGSGIGLATCKRIVDQHGGRLRVESAVGQGATFYFTLADAATDGPDSEKPAASRGAPAQRISSVTSRADRSESPLVHSSAARQPQIEIRSTSSE